MFSPPIADWITSCDVLDRQAVSRDRLTIDSDVGEVALRHALRVDAARAGHPLQVRSIASPEALDAVEIGAEHLDADRRLDAGQQHVQPVADRLRPDVRESRELQRGVHLGLQLLERHARPATASRGFSMTVVLTMPIGVLSVGVVPRPTVPNTRLDFRELAQQLVLHLQQPRAPR